MASKSKLGSAVIIGSGPGIGRHVAAKFAAQGFTKVALLARRAEKLHADRHFVISMANSKDIQVNIYPVDITNLSLFKTVLEQVQDDLGTPEFVSFNAAQVKPSTLLQFREEDLIEELTISTAALHVAAKWAIPQLIELAQLVLSASKAAQYNLTQSLAAVYGPQGVHIGVVVVGGIVDEESKVLNPKNIADKTWELYDDEKHPQRWSVEILE